MDQTLFFTLNLDLQNIHNFLYQNPNFTALKGHFVIHLGALSLYTKLVEIFIPIGPPWYIIIMCQRILANYFPFQRYWQIGLIFNFVLSTERNYATISNGPMKYTFWSITLKRNVRFAWNFECMLLSWISMEWCNKKILVRRHLDHEIPL